MANEAYVSLMGFVATQPQKGRTKTGTPALSMRVGWTPRVVDKATGEWSDLPSSFATVQCYRKIAEHAWICLRRGEPIVVRGTLRVREYTDQKGQRRSSVEIIAESIGHDISRGLSTYSKLPARTELTADEYEQAQAAGEHNDEPGGPGEADMDQVDPADAALDEGWDEQTADDEPGAADETLEPASGRG
jgi:single-strand DNA-binding protein